MPKHSYEMLIYCTNAVIIMAILCYIICYFDPNIPSPWCGAFLWFAPIIIIITDIACEWIISYKKYTEKDFS